METIPHVYLYTKRGGGGEGIVNDGEGTPLAQLKTYSTGKHCGPLPLTVHA